MLRQLLSTTNGVGSSYTTNDYEHCSTYPLNGRNYENSTVILPPSLLQPSQLQLPPSSSSSSTSLSLPLPLSPMQSSTGIVSAATSQNQFRINDDKNLSSVNYMSLATGYSMQAPITSNHLGILDTNNDLNDTTELFSSTYAMLSADSTLSWNVWNEQTRFSNSTNDFTTNEVPMNINSHNFGYPVHTTAPGCSNNVRYQSRNTNLTDNNYMANCQGLINGNRLELQQVVILPNNNDVGSINYVQQEKCSENSNQMTHSRFSDTKQRMIHAPISTGFGETVNKCERNQITCTACRSVYSSRKSLTGHIGRNEKCREIIGGNYLDQMGGFVESMRICKPGNVTNSNGVDPVCPYCDRFISHYKGNIRRHVNQCVRSARNGSKLRRKADHQSTVKTKSCNMKKDRGNDDPFRCPLCDFATIYKGNMKRHLSTCHGLQDDDLKDGCIDKLKYKEAINLRLENLSRNKRSKNLQYLRVTPKLAQIDIGNGPGSSTINCNAMKKISEITTADATPSTFRIVSSFNNCEEVLTLADGNTAIEVIPEGSLAKMVKTSSNDNASQILRLNAIDETIEAVIANGNENCFNEMSTDNNSNNNTTI
ncbi:C2H2-type zinc-finger domain family protein [Acanthocheilonema viteae]